MLVFILYLNDIWQKKNSKILIDVRRYLSGFHVIFVALMNIEAVSIEVF